MFEVDHAAPPAELSFRSIGKPIPRNEDKRLATGRGRFSDDFSLEGQAYAVMLRSPHPHARILGTGADCRADGLGAIPHDPLPKTKYDMKLHAAGGGAVFFGPHSLLPGDKARHVGEAVAMVVAETVPQALDAAEAVEIDYEVLPGVYHSEDAMRPGAPVIWSEVPSNVPIDTFFGDREATEEAFARADHVVALDLHIDRVTGLPLEPRAALGEYDSASGRYTLHAGSGGAVRQKRELAAVLGIAPERVRVLSYDVGGNFGTRNRVFVEFALVLWAARKLGRPVKFTATRSEAFLSDYQGRDLVTKVELALARDGRLLAMRATNISNVGAYCVSLSPLSKGAGLIVGPYAIPHAFLRAMAVFTNTTPTNAYRSSGRPEVTFAIERLIDTAAERLGIDRVELRRKNMLPESALPYQSPVGPFYDCGKFEENLDMALKLADVAGFAARKAESAKRGRLRGLGIVNAIEQAAGTAQPEYAEIRFNPSGTAALLMGTKNQGQGHETMFKQILHERLGIDPKDVQYIDGDTDRVAFGMGTNGSRSTVLGGSALFVAAGKVIEKGKRIAGHLLEAGEQDIEFKEGTFTVKGTDKSVPLKQVAMAAFNPTKWPKGGFEGGLYENATYLGQKDTFPNGCHICEVEVDPETGDVTPDRYFVVDDVGTVMNPIGLKGQIHGGVAQGIGQILCEQVIWDRQSGQLLTASFLDYAMPHAQMIPTMEVKSNPVPTKYNPLGAKGAGEAGTVGAMPVVMNAIMDALAPLGVKDVAMPATAQNVWRAIEAAKK
jgi:aerobic carbon-monoxide dehydrogenase large subunit